LYTDPPSAVGAWIALEDCTPANGCLVCLVNIDVVLIISHSCLVPIR
jgi:ectoine hydroxylase-related dioxygenase (phytanoyl-CoA dioxygenase family)